MPTTSFRTGALAQAEQAFALLTCEPAPLSFDGRPVPGMPDKTMPLDVLRRMMLFESPDSDTIDATWRQLARHAREWGPAWVVGAIGVALPALMHFAATFSRGYARHAEDIDSEILAEFLHALRTADLDRPRLWYRLTWAAWRGGEAVIKKIRDTDELPLDLSSGSRTPKRPYGHPDLLLGRAAAAGLITSEAAELISATRFGDALIETLAAEKGVTASMLRMRRRRAERAVAAAVVRGEVSGVVLRARSGEDRSAEARRNGVLSLPPRSASRLPQHAAELAIRGHGAI